MRMPNIKKYTSIFIAEDARHADRLIYVLNECRQEVPTILYKISEAYTNSGKDVDRMPSRKNLEYMYLNKCFTDIRSETSHLVRYVCLSDPRLKT